MDFLSILSIFVLACFVGYFVVWSVTPALHTPLMAVTNAISSVIIVGALIAGAASAQTPTANERYVSQGWHVGQLNGPFEEHVVAPGKPVFEQPFVADRLVTLAADILDASSNQQLAAAGETLFITHSHDGLIACRIGVFKQSGHFDLRFCFRDSDGNGTFDDYARYLVPGYDIPIVNGIFPKNPKLLSAPVTYSPASKAAAPDCAIVLVYSGRTAFGKPMLDFTIELRSGKDRSAIDHARVPVPTTPADIEIAGSTVHIEMLEDKSIRTRLVSPFKEEPILIFNNAGKFL